MAGQQEIPMQQNDFEQHESLIGNIIKQKRLVLFLVIGTISLGILIFFSVFTASTSTKNNNNNPTPIIPTKFQESSSPTSNDSQEVSEIKAEAIPQINQRVSVQYTISKVKTYGNNWAILEIRNPTTDPANIVLKRESGKWKVLMGPGTHFDKANFIKIGAPQNLINDANSDL